MELLGDVGRVEACFYPLEDYVNRDTGKVHGLRRIYHRHGNLFGCT
jgi:hypothetical protein